MTSSGDVSRAELAALRAAVGLVSDGTSSRVVLETIARYVAAALSPNYLEILQFEGDDHTSVIAAWATSRFGIVYLDRWDLDDDSLARRIEQSHAPARLERVGGPDAGAMDSPADRASITSSVGVPILVGEQVWGALFVHSVGSAPLPPDTESRLSGFTELIASVIASSRAQAQFQELAADQTALLRVAELVARGSAPADVFAAVAEELGRVLLVDGAQLVRYDDDDMATFVASWGPLEAGLPTGTRLRSAGNSVTGRIYSSSLPARVDDYATVAGEVRAVQPAVGMRSAVGAPIMVGGRLWGAVVVGSLGARHLPPHTEPRMVKFADLIAIAIANLQTRVAQEDLAKEQAALRRVATVVAREEWATTIPTIVREIGLLLGVDGAMMLRYEDEDTATVLAGWGKPTLTAISDMRLPIRGDNPVARVWKTRSSARQQGWEGSDGLLAALARHIGITSVVATPVVVENRLWGAIAVTNMTRRNLPADTEARVSQFGDLVATAIGNMKAHLDLLESRARIVQTADDTRRRFEHDLHDGIQQRLVTVTMEMRAAERALPADAAGVRMKISHSADALDLALDELRELSRGLHPAILSEGGLGPALRSLSRRADVPSRVHMDALPRFPQPIEVAAYYVVSESLANVSKHANATAVSVTATLEGNRLVVSVSDNGVGGARIAKGSGLIGLQDRVESVGGTLTIDSPRRRGTIVSARLPVAVL
ncbi:sensor histidine kinase [Lacisediminihabitans changchengi]|uniref:histidine kinase n=1 Tax=Lacisediminihabitans changchengi TaxID=2787634 RepID=A0A934SPF5_9MICO|nr:GAF domain-containing sensor histidine kinase [Lacisediminihabitans changchengi]MBK4348792.1 GAF domain-containing sensor histidine kinase [Lacisediminihabitans changchengi]